MAVEDRKIGLLSCIALVIGASVGSAIFSLSGLTVYLAGASSVLSWIIAAIVFSLYGMLVAELAVRYPRSGGTYVFPKMAIGGWRGSVSGFVCAWGFVVSNIVAIGFTAMYIGRYLLAGIYSLTSLPAADIISNGGPLSAPISAAVVVAVCIMLLKGGKGSQIIQNTLVFILLATIAVFCGMAFCGGHFSTDNFNGFFSRGVMGKSGFLTSVPIALVAYGGAIAVPFLASEIRRPERNIHRSLLLGLLAVALIYVALVLAILGNLPIDVLKENASLRLLPLFASVTDGSLSSCGWLVPVLSLSGLIALLTTVIALLRVNSKAVQAMAEESCLPAVFARENKSGASWVSLILMSAISAVMCFFPEITSRLILMGAVLNVVSMTVTVISLIIARRKNREYSGYRAPFGTLLPYVVIAVFWICYLPDLLAGTREVWLFSAVVYAAGLLVWLLMRRK